MGNNNNNKRRKFYGNNAGAAGNNGAAGRFSVVDCIGAEAVESCRRLAESEGVPLYVRKYIADS